MGEMIELWRDSHIYRDGLRLDEMWFGDEARMLGVREEEKNDICAL